MQPLQSTYPGTPWPPYAPQIVFNIGTGTPYYAAGIGVIPPLSQPLPQLQAALTSSKNLRCDGKKARDSDERNAVPADLSAEDEKALVHALRKWKEGGPTLQQVLKELSRKRGLPEHVWGKWFIANFEKLHSEVERASVYSRGSRSPVASRTRSNSRNWPSRSSTVTLTNERRTRPWNEEESESESGSESESEESSDDEGQGPTYRDPARSTGCIHRQQPHATKNKGMVPIGRSPSIQRPRTIVTDADLRAMALYRFEKGDSREVRRYRVAAWREFGERPENYSRRTVDAWVSIPRKGAHAAAINRYLAGYKRVAKGAESARRPMTLPLGARARVYNATSRPQSQIIVARPENAGDISNGRMNRSLDPHDIIDLTVETE